MRKIVHGECGKEVTSVEHVTFFPIADFSRIPGFFTVKLSCGCEYLDVEFNWVPDEARGVMQVQYLDSFTGDLVLSLEEPLSDYEEEEA